MAAAVVAAAAAMRFSFMTNSFSGGSRELGRLPFVWRSAFSRAGYPVFICWPFTFEFRLVGLRCG